MLAPKASCYVPTFTVRFVYKSWRSDQDRIWSLSIPPPWCVLQGKKQAGRLTALAGCYGALRATLRLLGLWADQPQHVLQELRQLALVRWVRVLAETSGL